MTTTDHQHEAEKAEYRRDTGEAVAPRDECQGITREVTFQEWVERNLPLNSDNQPYCSDETDPADIWDAAYQAAAAAREGEVKELVEVLDDVRSEMYICGLSEDTQKAVTAILAKHGRAGC